MDVIKNKTIYQLDEEIREINQIIDFLYSNLLEFTEDIYKNTEEFIITTILNQERKKLELIIQMKRQESDRKN